MRSTIEKLRVKLSFAAILLFLLLFSYTGIGWDAHAPAFALILFVIGLFLVAVASLGRMWCSLYIAGYKNDKLVTKGPYSICRNPLYFFSMLGVAGIGLATETITFTLVLLAIFGLYYPFVIRHEDKRLSSRFAEDYARYRAEVPAFLPRLSNLTEPVEYVVKPVIYKRHIFSALWFIWIVGLLELIEGLKELGVVTPLWTLY